MTKDQVLRLVLKALESTGENNGYHGVTQCFDEKMVDQAITAIKAALEAKDEPVAWYVERQHEGFRDHGLKYGPFWKRNDALEWCDDNHFLKNLYTTPPQQEAKDEPEYYGLTKDHLWMSISKEHYDRLKPEFRMACYTTPPQRKPLTDEEIWDAYMKAPVDIDCHVSDLHKFARAIESAHCITGDNNG